MSTLNNNNKESENNNNINDDIGFLLYLKKKENKKQQTITTNNSSETINDFDFNEISNENDFCKKDFNLYKNPQKKIIEISILSEEEEDEKNIEKNYVFNNNNFINIDYENFYYIVSEFYYPLFKNFNFIKENVFLKKIEKILNENFSVFDVDKKNNFFNYKLFEIIFIQFILDFNLIENNIFFNMNNINFLEDKNKIFYQLKNILNILYEILMLILVYNETFIFNNNNNIKSKNFQILCKNNFVNNYYKNYNNISISNNEIITKFKENNYILNQKLFAITEIIINLLYNNINVFEIDNDNSTDSSNNNNNNNNKNNNNEFLCDKLNYYENLIKILSLNNYNYPYIELKNSTKKTLISLKLNLYKININNKYILPPKKNPNLKFTIFLDLDETLVHYKEENNKAYISIRPLTNLFLYEMSKYFELIIFTASNEDYANLIINEIDGAKRISYKLYRKHTNFKNGFFFKDLEGIGRDLNKICIVDNNKKNFELQNENGIEIKDFLGDENDNELNFLMEEFKKIIEIDKKEAIEDIRPFIMNINNNMQKRYKNINNINNNK